MIEIYLLEQLTAVKQFGTLLAASEHLHISQPALSRSMKKLEAELDTVLFDRSVNHMTLNSAGQLTCTCAEQVLHSEEMLVETVQNYDRSLHTVTIGSCTPGPLMEYPALLQQCFSSMTIAAEQKEEKELINDLNSHHCQLIILPHAIEKKGYVCRQCGSEHLYASVIPAHPMAAYQKQGITFHDMNGETFLMNSNVGIWENIVRNAMPDSKLILQDGIEELSEIVNASSIPSFCTDLTLRVRGDSYRSSRISVPFNDPEAAQTYYAVCLTSDENRLKPWFRLMSVHSSAAVK